MTHYDSTVTINAPARTVASILLDLDAWTRWTTTVDEVTTLRGRGKKPGTRVRVRQPGLPVSVWTVDVAEQGRFEWNNVRYGLRTVARHVLDETPQGCRLTVDIEQTGVLEPAIRLVYGRLIRRHLEAMTVQLKQAAEAAAQVGEPSAPVLRDVG